MTQADEQNQPSDVEKAANAARVAEIHAELTKRRLVSVQLCEWAGLLQDGRAVICGPFESMRMTEEQWGTVVSVFFVIKGYDTQSRPFHVELYNPDGSPYGQFETDVAPLATPDDDRKLGTVISRLNMSFAQEGLHWFEISYDNVLLGRFGFTVKKAIGVENANN